MFTKNRDRLLADDIPGHRIMPGADKGYDTRDFVAGIRRRGVTPHVAQNTKGRRSAIDRRTPRHRGDAVSVRKRIEEVFGWMKTVGGLRKTRHRTGRLDVHAHRRRLQLCADAQAAGCRGVAAP